MAIGRDIYSIRATGGGIWNFCCLAKGTSHLTTGVDCTCPDHKYRKQVCKHMRAVQEYLT